MFDFKKKMGEPWHKPKLKVPKAGSGQQAGQQAGSSKIRARPAEQKTLAEDDLKPEFKLKVAEWEVSNYRCRRRLKKNTISKAVG